MRYESTQFQSAEFSVLVTSPPRTRFCGFESPRSSRLESGLKFRGRESFVVGEVQGRPLTRNGELVNLGPRSTQREVVRLELRDRPVRRCTGIPKSPRPCTWRTGQESTLGWSIAPPFVLLGLLCVFVNMDPQKLPPRGASKGISSDPLVLAAAATLSVPRHPPWSLSVAPS